MQEQILAILLAVLPASLGYLAKLSAESLACRRLILSYLLEIRHTLMCTSLTAEKLSKGFDSALEQIFEKYRQHDHESAINEALCVVKPLAYQMFHKTINNYVPKFDDVFIAEFNAALKDFRKEKPLLAFYLVGWEKEQTYLRIKQDYAVQVSGLDELNNSLPLKQFLEKTLTEDEDQSLIESVRLLDSLIFKIARRSGLITLAKISHYLYRRPVVAFSVNDSDLLENMEPILAMIEELVKSLLSTEGKSDSEADLHVNR